MIAMKHRTIMYLCDLSVRACFIACNYVYVSVLLVFFSVIYI